MTTVGIREAGRVLHALPGDNILQTALAAGLPYPHGCRSGRCGACKSRLVAGEVELLECGKFALTQRERDDGLVLACRSIPKTDVVVSWLGDEDNVAAHAHRDAMARVVSIDDATHDIRRVRLALEGAPLEFSAGQYARFTFAGAPPRDYSMAIPSGDDTLEIHVRRVPGGVTSGVVASALSVGDRVRVEGPFGSAYLRTEHEGAIVAIAGGSGLAPIRAIVDAALRHGMRQPVHVYFGVRAARDLYLVDHFEALARAHPNLRFHTVLSQHEEPARNASSRTGFVSDAVAADLVSFAGCKAYLAGPPAMVEASLAVLHAGGIRAQDVHADVFFTPPAAEAPAFSTGIHDDTHEEVTP